MPLTYNVVCRLNIDRIDIVEQASPILQIRRPHILESSLQKRPVQSQKSPDSPDSITLDPVNVGDDGFAEPSNRLTAGSRAAINVHSRAHSLRSGPTAPC